MMRSLIFTALSIILLTGACSRPAHDQAHAQSAATALTLIGTSWQVEDIDGSGIVAASNITLLFPEDGKVAGSSGCNRYFGAVSIGGDAISFSDTGGTRMACPEALMNQERRYFDALGEITRGEIDADNRLVLFDEAGIPRIRATEYVPADPITDNKQAVPMDKSSDKGFSFNCGEAGNAEVRFLGPDTVELKFISASYILPSERAASGARYSADGVTFWNKGDAALIEVDEERYSCARR